MISVIIPTLQSERDIADMLISLMPAIMNGLVSEVIVSDGGSCDATFEICDEMGATFLKGILGRGQQMSAGGEAAKGDWLLFLHVDTQLQEGWVDAIGQFSAQTESVHHAGYFQFSLNDKGIMPRLVEKAVALRCRYLGLPYGDQGLLISRTLYDEIGGYAEMPLMEDVEIVQKIGVSRLKALPAMIKTSPDRYKQDGYVMRVGRNLLCLLLYFMGAKPETIAKIYQKKPL